MPRSGENLARSLTTLERLLAIPTAELDVALSYATDAVAAALDADKVDAFLHDPARDSLVAVGTSHQPLSALERQMGLDVMPIANGGRAVQVYLTGKPFRTGRLDLDPEALRGPKEALAIRSEVAVPLEVGGERRGVMMAASQKPDFFSEADLRFTTSVARWVGMIAHRSELIAESGRNALEQGRRAAAEELVTVLAHDLRNHISPIDLRLNVLRRRAERHRRTDDVADLERASLGLARLAGMIEELLDVARIDQGVLRMDVRPVELVGLVEETASVLQVPEHPIHVRYREHPIVVAADADRVRQALENLLSNAVQHSPRGSPVVVEVAREARSGEILARVDVLDEGPGVPEELLPRIFERFVTGKDDGKGLGIGLYLAKCIAVMHGGDLTVASIAGKGARFTLTLPCLQTD